MDTLKLLIADSSEDFRNALSEALRGAFRLRSSRDGLQTMELLRNFTPDVVVLDLMMPGLDGITLLQMAQEEGIRPLILATTRFTNDYVLQAVERMGVAYLMVKPCDIRAVAARVSDLSSQLKAPVLSRPDARTAVSNMLLNLGIPTKLRGYSYLREAVLVMSRDMEQSVTKELYPAVADLINGTTAQVERSIRCAIGAAWSSRDEQIWRLYFPPGPDGRIKRPTNAAFITRLADMLQLEEQAQNQ